MLRGMNCGPAGFPSPLPSSIPRVLAMSAAWSFCNATSVSVAVFARCSASLRSRRERTAANESSSTTFLRSLPQEKHACVKDQSNSAPSSTSCATRSLSTEISPSRARMVSRDLSSCSSTPRSFSASWITEELSLVSWPFTIAASSLDAFSRTCSRSTSDSSAPRTSAADFTAVSLCLFACISCDSSSKFRRCRAPTWPWLDSRSRPCASSSSSRCRILSSSSYCFSRRRRSSSAMDSSCTAAVFVVSSSCVLTCDSCTPTVEFKKSSSSFSMRASRSNLAALALASAASTMRTWCRSRNSASSAREASNASRSCAGNHATMHTIHDDNHSRGQHWDTSTGPQNSVQNTSDNSP